MDRPIERKRSWTTRRVAIAGAAVVVVLLTMLLARSGKSQFNVDSNRLTFSEVRTGEFQEYVPVSGKVLPRTTVYLDLAEGGIVDRVYLESGQQITKGTLIMSLSNTAAQKQNIDAETRLIDNLNQLRNSKISVTTSNLTLRQELLDLEYSIVNLEKTYLRYQKLIKIPNSALTQEQFEKTRDELTYLKEKRALLRERIQRETDLQQQQSAQIDSSIKRVDRNMELLSRIIDSLDVRSPIDGYLSTLNAEVGQSIERGQRVGQIDQLDSFKVQADIDQYYISRVAVGQNGKFDFDGKSYSLKVSKIYPEVNEDVFQVDMTFVDALPDGIKRGQTLQIDLNLSESKTTNIVDMGGFYHYTQGRWAYVVAGDGRSARRTNIVLGRQNPQSVEILQGLKPGDRIVTSDYETFNGVDVLNFPQPLGMR
ncbi:MAG: HlyD family efflux transporter periplasmic adaptor subunit [Rhodanobacteraceae bacterium]|nr:HlyD family efflux transporter periplasmic adaptor subunit [Rhodanobacteraceae bacterium]